MTKRKAIHTITNQILCKDCEFHYDPDWTNLGADSKLPILCRCRHSEYKVFYNTLEKKCTKSKLLSKIKNQ